MEHRKHTSCRSYVYVVKKISDRFISLVAKLMLQFVCAFSTGLRMPGGFLTQLHYIEMISGMLRLSAF
jgi:hypothetical protein